MNKEIYCGWASRRLIGLLAFLALGLLLLSACNGGGSSNTESTKSANNGGSSKALTGLTSKTSANLNSNAGANAGCDQMARVMISEHAVASKGDEYFFTPNHVTVKAGQFITFDNQSDEVHKLVTTPDAGLADSSIDRNEDQPVQFTKAGTYTLESQDAKHRATMQVTVVSPSGLTCGLSAPNATITFTEKHALGQADLYALAPKTVSMKAGQSVDLLNKTDQALNFSCKPSADIVEGNLRVDMNERQIVQFPKSGQYACISTTAPTEKVSVIVH